MEELKAAGKVVLWVIAAMAGARFIASLTKPGWLRFLFLLPVICLLSFLPMHFSTVHLRSISAFFLAWLALFKLFLLSAGSGPLSADLPFFTFLASATLPVKLVHQQSPQKPKNPTTTSLFLPSAAKAALLSVLISCYRFKDTIHPYLLLAIYSIHMYLALELVLAAAAVVASLLLPQALQLEPQFDAPYLSTSLTDFWGRRWNIMVSAILRPSVYLPVRNRCGRPAGVLATFLVSGLMHEFMFWYMTLAPPTGEATAFFEIHAVCVVAEEVARRLGWRLPAPVATPLTLGFVAATGFWLFFPPILRSRTDEAVLAECTAAMAFPEAVVGKILEWCRLT
ncbi:putative long-chain-alcohol O-fatty-acyltransferase 4 [Curcuma longa]|uniref:putative long-chain-alcohol O-fatty-acyltransferase 4 n=1 Tax=Curcuma longa TaxID=136217 RepID=UPI003D9EAA1A